MRPVKLLIGHKLPDGYHRLVVVDGLMTDGRQMAELSPQRSELIARAHAVGSVLVTHADYAEAEGRIHPRVVDALVDAGVPRLFLPEPLGGYEVDPLTCAEVCEVLAAYDASAAWHVMVYNAARLMAATWPQQTLDAVWGQNPDAMVSASGHTPFIGSPILSNAGQVYAVSGTNSFVSGCHHAHYIMSPMRVKKRSNEEAFEETAYLALVPRGAYEVLDNWNSLGMRGSGSNDVCVADYELPPTLTVAAVNEPVLSPYHHGRLYRCPSRVVFATYIPVALALAKRALQELEALAQDKVPYASDQKLRQRSQAQMHYGRGLAKYRAARGYFYAALQHVWDLADEGYAFSVTEKADLYLAGTHTMQTCAEVVRHVADAAGSSVLAKGQPLEQIVRDMETLKHHGFANESRYGSVTQALWGTELDYPLILR